MLLRPCLLDNAPAEGWQGMFCAVCMRFSACRAIRLRMHPLQLVAAHAAGVL